MQERDLLVEPKVLEQRVLAEGFFTCINPKPGASQTLHGARMQERDLLVELKVLEQRVLAEERGSHYSGASLAAEEDRQPLLQQRCGPGRRHLCQGIGELLPGCEALQAPVPGALQIADRGSKLELAMSSCDASGTALHY